MQTNTYESLIAKIDEFIRKYYVNQLIRGALYTLAGVMAMVITFTLVEHFVFRSSVSSIELRKSLFYGFVALSLLMLAVWIIKPLIAYFKLGKVISHEQAAQIIGTHFTTVQDKLINVLQLKKQANQQQTDLLLASIDQKAEELRPVPFKAAIDLTENKKYLRFALPPVFLLLGLLLFSNIVQRSTNRILNNDKEFEPEMLFKLLVKEEAPKVVQYEDYDLEVKVEGEVLIKELFLEVDNLRYKLEKVNDNTFTYKFSKLSRDTDFRLKTGNFTSKNYKIDVLEKPHIVSFDMELKYPAYTGRKSEQISNMGDITVPVGTHIDWLFNADNTEDILVRFEGEEEFKAIERKNAQTFSLSKKILKSAQYQVKVANKEILNGDSVTYTLSVIPDLHPSIEVESVRDSFNKKLVHFAGQASDDYGIRVVSFHYELTRNQKKVAEKVIPLVTNPGKQTVYQYLLDVATLNLQPGDKLSYYFQVFDNDAVQGSKSARTTTMYYEMPTLEQIAQLEQNNNSDIKQNIDASLKEMQNLKNNINKVQNSIIQKPSLDWQDRKDLENILQQQKELEKKLEDSKKKMEENLKNQEEFKKEDIDPELLAKQELLEKLFNEVMDEETKKLFEELEKMLENLNKTEIMENLKEMNLSNEEMQKEMDRMLELFKQMEVEKGLDEALDKLDELAKQQEELAKALEKENLDSKTQEELRKQQEELNKAFDKIMEDLKQLAEQNQELENPFDMDANELQQEGEEIDQEMEKSAKDLKEKKNKEAQKSQKNAAQKMKDMAKKARDKKNEGSQEQMEEDLKAIRQLLENIVDLSKEQERIQAEVQRAMVNTPNYISLVQQQYKLKDDFRHVEDSLHTLAKRVVQLESIITDKVSDIKKGVQKSISLLEERDKRTASVHQQSTMTYLNDLALMLSESMEEMQQDMAANMPGEQMCEKGDDGENDGEGEGQDGGEGKGKKKGKKKGKGKGKGKGQGDGPGDLKNARQSQEQLRKQLEQMQKDAQNGKNPSSKEFAQMAARQAAIRKAIQELKRQQQEEGKGGQNGKKLQELIDQMEKVETDLVNKRVPNSETMRRQQDIMTRLLEAENAEREREYEEKRKAEVAKEQQNSMPPALADYIKQRQAQVDMFKTVSPTLKPYYKGLVEDYFNTVK